MASGNHSRALRCASVGSAVLCAFTKCRTSEDVSSAFLYDTQRAVAIGIAALLGDPDKLLPVALAEKRRIRSPVVLHIDAQIPRHAVEQAVARVQTVAIPLTEGQRGKKGLQPGEVVIGQTPHRLVQGEFLGERRREAAPHRLPFLDGEAEFASEAPRLFLKNAVRALRLRFLAQGGECLVQPEPFQGADDQHFLRRARTGEKDFRDRCRLVVGDIAAKRRGIRRLDLHRGDGVLRNRLGGFLLDLGPDQTFADFDRAGWREIDKDAAFLVLPRLAVLPVGEAVFLRHRDPRRAGLVVLPQFLDRFLLQGEELLGIVKIGSLVLGKEVGGDGACVFLGREYRQSHGRAIIQQRWP